MAGEASHIRFALEFSDQLQVADRTQFLSGTIYPDSRYVTGIDRELTHAHGFISKHLESSSDFEKGWALHILCDEVLRKVHEESFAGEVSISEDRIERWLCHTALKVLQDIQDAKLSPVDDYKAALSYVGSPNGEDPNKVKEFNHIIIDTLNGGVPSIDKLVVMWLRLTDDKETAEKIRAKTEEFAELPSMDARISKAYDMIVQDGQMFINSVLKKQ